MVAYILERNKTSCLDFWMNQYFGLPIFQKESDFRCLGFLETRSGGCVDFWTNQDICVEFCTNQDFGLSRFLNISDLRYLHFLAKQDYWVPRFLNEPRLEVIQRHSSERLVS